MSSLPPQRSSPRNQGSLSASQEASPEQSPGPEQERRPERKTSLSKSTASVDSQTLLLNTPPESADSQTPEAASSHRDPPSTEEPQKCWICFSDETEDSPTSSRWRSPCSCALTAHESCLLDWVADLEAPSSRRRSGSPAKIQCPQCKSDIVIARPKNYLVEGVKYVDRAASRAVVPGIVLTLVGSFWTGATMHGITSVYLIFGRRDFETLLGNPDRISAKWFAGFPLIPFALILSRTTLGDAILPALPALFFATTIQTNNYGFLRERQQLWPPSAAMTIAALPCVRVVYNELYKRVFAEREQRWIKEVQPRAGENPEGNAGHDHGHEHGGMELEMDWNLEVELFEEVEEEDPAEQQQPRRRGQGRARGQNAPAAAAQNEGGEGNNAEVQQENQAENRQADRRQAQNRAHPLVVATSRITDAVMGALCFPAIASAMGMLLKLGLPRSWTAASYSRRPGLLHTQWGRSIIGGCLFVVMKDSLILYSRYRTARDHRYRKIMNYDKSTGKYVD